MPELPETETIARDLNAALGGARISGVVVLRSDVLRETSRRELVRRVTGATIRTTNRRAKLVVIELSSGDRIVVQPRFTGALIIDHSALPERERRYVTVSFSFDDGRVLHYRDIRRLGTVSLMAPKRWQEYSAKLGVEPLDPTFTPAHLSATLRGSRQAVKKVLMDQRRIAGVGNIYANESLWRARIDPSRPARSLSEADARLLHLELTGVLREAIEARGTSLRDYRDASGERGAFGASLAAYGRSGQPCLRCGTSLVGTSAIDGRATVLCPRCQQ